MLGNEPVQWLNEEGPGNDVVASSRVRLARNVAGFKFVDHCGETERAELQRLVRGVLLDSNLAPALTWVDLDESSERYRQMLVERHLISRNLADQNGRRGVAIARDESLSVMVNEEDHLRIQMLAPGMQLESLAQRLNEIDDIVESRLDYSFDQRWGYLTACPTNVGTGIRFSTMMHLPGLKITNEIERVRRAAKDLHLAVRGYYGEGSEAVGDFYQISNQVTLGKGEHDLLRELAGEIVPRIVQYEQRARQMLAKQNEMLLDDRLHRALGILRSARLLGIDEAMKLLSRVRLGAYIGRLPNIDPVSVNQLFVKIQPAHLQLALDVDLTSDELRAARADLVRRTLL